MGNKEINILAFIAVIISIICVTVAFATISTTFQIEGNLPSRKNNWSIKFKKPTNVNTSANSGFVDSLLPTIVGNKIYFNLELTGLNEFVEFDLPIENAGTLNSILSTINISKNGLDANKIIIKILDLSGNQINNGEFYLDKGMEKRLRIRIEVDPSLPSFDIIGNSVVQTQIAFEFTQK